uniref:Uncharacterized protein n=1 Tax=Stomoxys calcitrans TaxID=35570 RepID=A0A1I8NY43_STOCA
MCQESEGKGRTNLKELVDLNLVEDYADDMETIMVNGNITIKVALDPKIPIGLDIEFYKWERGNWVNTIFSLSRNNLCSSFLVPTEVWYSIVTQLPEEDHLCPPEKGHVYNAVHYTVLSDGMDSINMCDDSEGKGRTNLKELADINLVEDYADDMETIVVNGNVTIKVDLDPKIPIRMDIEFYKWERGNWVNTIFSISRKNLCASFLVPTEIWYPTVNQLPEEDRLCPPKKGAAHYTILGDGMDFFKMCDESEFKGGDNLEELADINLVQDYADDMETVIVNGNITVKVDMDPKIPIGATNYTFIGDGMHFFNTCDEKDALGMVGLDDLTDYNLVDEYADDMETIITNGNITVKVDLDPKTRIKTVHYTILGDGMSFLNMCNEEEAKGMSRLDDLAELNLVDEYADDMETILTSGNITLKIYVDPKTPVSHVFQLQNFSNRIELPNMSLLGDFSGKYKSIVHFKIANYTLCTSCTVDVWKS